MEFMFAFIMYIRGRLPKICIERYRAEFEFEFWNKFLTKLCPILKDLTRSHRESDWLLHVRVLQFSLLLFFCYDRTNYGRWDRHCYEDCLKLATTFFEIYEEFKNRYFAINFKKICASAVPMDQPLEKAHNKPLNVQCGIIIGGTDSSYKKGRGGGGVGGVGGLSFWNFHKKRGLFKWFI